MFAVYILDTEQQVILQSVNLTDDGRYVCRAENPAGSTKIIFFVSVLCKFIRYQRSIEVVEDVNKLTNGKLTNAYIFRVLTHNTY